MQLIGKNALVTGGAIRIGKAIAIELAKNGVNLALVYNRSEDAALQLKNELSEYRVRIHLFQADLSDTDSIPALMERVFQCLGAIDILINNAGIYPKGQLLNLDKPLLDEVFSVNLYSPLFLMREFAKQIPNDQKGKIVNIIDANVFKNAPDHFAYRLTKLALWQATQLAALELAPNITVNAVSPGLMMSLAGKEHVDMQAVANRRIPLKIPGSAQIVAENVIHILKQDFMTGNNIIIDGGESV